MEAIIDTEEKIRDVISLGLKDLDSSRVQNWCKHIQIEYFPSPLGQMIKLPSLGTKRISCKYGKYPSEGFSLDVISKGFYEDNCRNCDKHEEASWDNIFRMEKKFFNYFIRTKTRLTNFKNDILTIKMYLLIGIAFLLVIFLSTNYIELFPSNFLTTLTQANATIFALAFTIPLIITQLGKYPIKVSFFRGYSLVYMILYIVAIFLPLISPKIMKSFVFSFSILCALLLIPYLKHVQESLSPIQVVKGYEKKALLTIQKNDGEEFKRLIEKTSEIALQAINIKDYGVLSLTFDRFVNLAQKSSSTSLKIMSERKDAWIFVGDKMEIISEQSIKDRGALRIVCNKILSLNTKAMNKQVFNLALDSLEFNILGVLAKITDDAELWYAYHPVSSLIEHALFSPIIEVREKRLDDTILLLLKLKEETIDNANILLQTQYNVRYGDGTLKKTLQGILAVLYLDYKKKLRNKLKARARVQSE